MTIALMAQQQALVAALLTRTNAPGVAALPGVQGGIDRGLLAYRVNAQALSAKALVAVYPQLQSLLLLRCCQPPVHAHQCRKPRLL